MNSENKQHTFKLPIGALGPRTKLIIKMKDKDGKEYNPRDYIKGFDFTDASGNIIIVDPTILK